MSALLSMFGAAFDDAPSYEARRPGPAYLRSLLGSDTFIALAALDAGEVVGGLARGGGFAPAARHRHRHD